MKCFNRFHTIYQHEYISHGEGYEKCLPIFDDFIVLATNRGEETQSQQIQLCLPRGSNQEMISL